MSVVELYAIKCDGDHCSGGIIGLRRSGLHHFGLTTGWLYLSKREALRENEKIQDSEGRVMCDDCEEEEAEEKAETEG